MFIRVSSLVVVLLLAGCVGFPEQLEVADPNSLVSYQQAASKTEQVTGQTIRWGGAIAKIDNKEKSTVLEMVYYPLTSYGRPVSDEESMGRYRVHVNGFMDPMVYQVGRLMTFTGKLKGVEEGLVGEHKYVFPSVEGDSYYLWKKLQRVDISTVDMWPHDYWWGLYPRPYHRRVIIRTSNDVSKPSSTSSGNATKPSRVTTYPKPVQTRSDIR